MSVHIGEKIKQRAKELRIGPTELGKLIFTSKQNMSGIFKRKSVDVELLRKLSKALTYDFFQYYLPATVSNVEDEIPAYNKLDKKSVSKLLHELQKQNAELQKMIRQKDAEIMNLQKKTISLLEKKGKV